MPSQARSTETHQKYDDQHWRRFESRFGGFWTIVIYCFAAIGVYNVYTEDRVRFFGWYGLGLAGLLVAFFVLFHLVFLRSEGLTSPWQTVLFGGIQIVILALLLRYDPVFSSLGFWLMAYFIFVLPPKQWMVAVPAVLMVMLTGWGVHRALLNGGWVDAGLVLFQVSLWVAIFIFIRILFTQRFELKTVVDELRHAKAELEASAAQAEELAALRERNRLAREMHNSLGHALVAINVKLEAAQRLYAVDPNRGAAELEATRALVRDTMSELRASLANLRSSLPDRHDLPLALQRLAADFRERSKLDITCDLPTELPELAPPIAEALWRVAREALTNVERHAAAASATLDLERRDGSLVLRITDDGSGIKSADLDRPGHFGIVGMRERVESLGGSLSVIARPRGGTVVEARVPMEN